MSAPVKVRAMSTYGEVHPRRFLVSGKRSGRKWHIWVKSRAGVILGRGYAASLEVAVSEAMRVVRATSGEDASAREVALEDALLSELLGDGS